MNRIFFFILLAILLALTSCTQTAEESLTAEPEYLFFGDPYVLVDDGIYYMYGTGRDSDTGIAVYKSDNLEVWEGPAGATDGQLYITYHAHFDQDNVHPRIAYINPVEFVYIEDEKRNRITFSQPGIVPKLLTDTE